jgi:hypothetical protein
LVKIIKTRPCKSLLFWGTRCHILLATTEIKLWMMALAH